MSTTLLVQIIRLHLALINLHGDRSRRRVHGDTGQATTEYALVLLAAALVGLLVVAWATAGGGAERVAQLFNRVIDGAIERV